MGKIGDSISNTCSVPQCKSRSTNEISLFRFPKEEAQRKKWADAIKIENKITPNMQICSRHFMKNDYIISDNAGTKVKRLKKTAVPSQNLPWQFPNKRVSPTLAKARMERLKNRSLQKVSDSPNIKSETPAKKSEVAKKTESNKSSVSISKSPEKTDEADTIKSEEMCDDDGSAGETSVDPVDADRDIKEALEENSGDSEAKKDDNMLARGPTRLRQKEGVLKCEICGRKCLTPQALQTHQLNAHKNSRNSISNPKKESPVINKAKSSPKPTTVGLISVKSPENLLANPNQRSLINLKPEKSLNSREVEKVLLEDSDYLATGSDSDVSIKEEIIEKKDQRKTEFECPKCMRRFAVYFMALKHIQKHHSGTTNGSKMTNLPKPTRIEICTICNVTVDGDIHTCAGPLKLAMGFICTGCSQEFKTLTMFDNHKSSMHSDGVESMFFSTLEEFDQWKKKMETQTQVKYSILDQNDTKKIYRCSHRIATGMGNFSKHRMCPSCVVVQEFTRGYQVHYYPCHFDHSHQKYNLSNDFKEFSITSLMKLTAKQLPDSDEESPDLYLQFKKITETLVNEAARINVNGLKKLMRKALDMLDIVNSYVEDEDDDITSVNSILKLDSEKDNLQFEVRKALYSLKRKQVTQEVPAKKSKSVFQSTENTLKTAISGPISIKKEPDSVKNTIEVNSPPENAKKNLIKLNQTPEIVKKNPLKVNQTPENVKKNPLKPNQSPTFIDTYQDFVGKSFSKPDQKKKRQSDSKKTPPVKTKMGQFKPKTPPKKVSFSPTKLSPKTSVGSVKEVKYEVKEQENDCNILILKI